MFLISCQVPPFFCLGGKYTSNNNNTRKKNRKEALAILLCVICQSSVPFFSISNRDSLDIKEEKDHSTLPCKYTYKKNKFYFSSSD